MDPDGDLLVFSFETRTTPPSSVVGSFLLRVSFPGPCPQIGYQGGFSAAQPFGGTGYSFVNRATGLTRYFSPNQELRRGGGGEGIRNGQLIGRIRRDLQLQVVVCPPNATPSLTSIVQQTYSVSAGDTCALTWTSWTRTVTRAYPDRGRGHLRPQPGGPTCRDQRTGRGARCGGCPVLLGHRM